MTATLSMLEPGRVYRTRDLAVFSANPARWARRLMERGDLRLLAQGLYDRPRLGRFGPRLPDDREAGLEVWFKGGTSLFKGFGIIERFFEDLDLKIEPGTAIGVPPSLSWKGEYSSHEQARKSWFENLASVVPIPGCETVLNNEIVDPRWRSAVIDVVYPGILSDVEHWIHGLQETHLLPLRHCLLNLALDALQGFDMLLQLLGERPRLRRP